jgi:cystathionine gamma-synthase
MISVFIPGFGPSPAMTSQPGRLQEGFGGMLSLQVRGGAAEALRIIGKLQVWKRATSLGGVESPIEHRASVEGPKSGTAPNLLRLSVGIVDPEDLISDLSGALE